MMAPCPEEPRPGGYLRVRPFPAQRAGAGARMDPVRVPVIGGLVAVQAHIR